MTANRVKRTKKTTDVITHNPSGNFRKEGSHMPIKSSARARTNAKGETEWIENPFWSALEIPTSRKKITINEDNIKTVNTKTGAETGTAEITKVYEVDKDIFVKVFARQLTVFFDLSQVGIKLLEVIMHEAGRDANTDAIYLSPISTKDYMNKVGKRYSQASYYRGRDELLGKGFIAKSVRQHIYFINPAMIWNGDRVKFITELSPAPEVLDQPDEGAS
jgi:hypothetical protein